MKITFTVAALAIATGTVSASSSITCATGPYILTARGSGEPATSPDDVPFYPPSTGEAGYIALAVKKQIKGTIVAGVDYPAFDPIGDVNNTTQILAALNLTGYYPSEKKGAKAFEDEINQYHAACPDSKIVIIGFSQGAQLVRDGLCGGIGGKFNSEKPLPSNLIEKNVVAIVLLGDATHVANEPINRGTGSGKDGFFKRTDLSTCKHYYDITASWCDLGDPICAGGNNMTIHQLEPQTHLDDATKFILERWQNETLSGASGSSTAATGSSATATSTSVPAKPTSVTAAAASGRNLFQPAALWIASLTVLLSLK